jgi:hypothetical protein
MGPHAPLIQTVKPLLAQRRILLSAPGGYPEHAETERLLGCLSAVTQLGPLRVLCRSCNSRRGARSALREDVGLSDKQ